MILHVIDSLATGGAERALVTLVTALWQRGEAVGVCVTRSNLDMQQYLPPTVPLLVLGRRRRFDLGALRRFGRWCKTHEVTVLHAHGRSSMMFVAFARALRLTSARLVFHDHFGRVELETGASVAMRFAVRRIVDAYVCVSPALVEWATTRLGLHPDRILLLPNAVSLESWRPSEVGQTSGVTRTSGPVQAICIANVRQEKDHRMLLAAIAQSDLLRTSLSLKCIGGGQDSPLGRELESIRREMRLQDCVHFLGVRTDVAALIDGSDFGVVSSKSEAGPIASLEYMAMGKPFVTTRTGQVVGLATPVGACLAVSPGSVDEMRSALERMVEFSPQDRARMGAAGRKLVATVFRQNAQVDGLVSLYRSLLGIVVAPTAGENHGSTYGVSASATLDNL